jgi:hypothetical protein
MTARIQRDFEFVSGVFVDNELYMNIYNFDVHFNVQSESIEAQNIALDRVKHLISTLENVVFVYDKDIETIEKLYNADIRVCTLPEEPYDQIVGIMLLVKINAITEGNLVASDISILSKMSDGVSCLHSIEENTGPFKLKGWWNDSSPKLSNGIPKVKGKKVVRLPKTPNNWDDLNLNWETKKESNVISEIVFASFESKTEK